MYFEIFVIVTFLAMCFCDPFLVAYWKAWFRDQWYRIKEYFKK
jgi:hypothetical protein